MQTFLDKSLWFLEKLLDSWVSFFLGRTVIHVVAHNSVKGGVEVIDCIVLSAENWCPYSTLPK